MKIIMRVAIVIVLLLAGFAAGFPIGQTIGFSTGSEWAIIQAELIAKEAGVFMPVNYKAGKFRIIVKQPDHLYKRAWQLADQHEEAMEYVNQGKRTLGETVSLARNTSVMQ